MDDTLTAHEYATRFAALISESPDEVAAADAAAAGTGLLDALALDADLDDIRLVTRLIGFALRAAPDHPAAAEWWETLGFAHGRIAGETRSTTEYATAIACSRTAMSARGAPPEVAEWAAGDVAHLTAALLQLGAEEQSVTAERARQLISALDGTSLPWTDVRNAVRFRFGCAQALRWSYVLTSDVADLERAAALLREALAEPVPAEEDGGRVGGWELLAIVCEERYASSGSQEPLAEALAAATKVCELLPEDDEWLPFANGTVAELAGEIFWNGDGEPGPALDTAITAWAAKRAATGLDDEETVAYALLLQARGCEPGDGPALAAAVEVLETPERSDGAEVVLAGLHELLIHVAGLEHAWQTIDWATRALSRADLSPDVLVPLHGSRIIGLAAALEAFGGDEVAVRCDADAILAGARIEALAGADAVRAELEFRTAQLRGQWTADRFPLDVDLMRTTSAEMAAALLRMREYADEDRKPGLAAVAAVLEGMADVVAGEGGLSALRATLLDENLRDMPDVAGLLSWIDQYATLVSVRDGGRPAGPEIQNVLSAFVENIPLEEGDSGAGALLSLVRALAGVAGDDDPATRRAAYQEVLRRCGELPEHMASAPPIREIRDFATAEMTTVRHPGDQVEHTIDELERALEQTDDRWPGQEAHLAERLGHLLRGRGGHGDAERARKLALDVLGRQTWRLLTRRGQYDAASTSRFARLAGDWCREDDAQDDLVRIVEAARGVALARGSGAALLRAYLVATGRATLAEEWVAGTAEHPDLTALLSEEDRGVLTAPLGPAEIRPLLRNQGLDVLVYLVPGPATVGGTAVVVPAKGVVTSARLPLLTVEWLTGAGGAEPVAPDALAGWAWFAGGAALLAAARAVASGGVPRVALVPAAALGAVPWPAAWRDTGNGRRHLVEDLELTLVPSARSLHRAPAEHGEPVLLPTQDRMSGPDYDEALEPASTLLAEGARSVVRGAWQSPAGSVLSALFRHYLPENPANPAAAFRKSQLWLLGPRDEPLPDVCLDGVDDLADIANWGRFAHIGA